MNLFLALLFIFIAPVAADKTISGKTVSLNMAKCLLEKSPAKARELVVMKERESTAIPKKPCGTLPPNFPSYRLNYQHLLEHIKNHYRRRVLNCMKSHPNYGEYAALFTEELNRKSYLKKVSKAEKKWIKEGQVSYLPKPVEVGPMPVFRKLEIAAKLPSAKKLMALGRSCDAEFVNADRNHILLLSHPILVRN